MAPSVNDPSFCPLFKAAAICHCTSSGLPSGMCQDTEALYGRMIIVFGSLQKACEYQKYVSVQTCMDNWNCYRTGKDTAGKLCNPSGSACS